MVPQIYGKKPVNLLRHLEHVCPIIELYPFLICHSKCPADYLLNIYNTFYVKKVYRFSENQLIRYVLFCTHPMFTPFIISLFFLQKKHKSCSYLQQIVEGQMKLIIKKSVVYFCVQGSNSARKINMNGFPLLISLPLPTLPKLFITEKK